MNSQGVFLFLNFAHDEISVVEWFLDFSAKRNTNYMKKIYIILLLLISQEVFSQYSSSGIGRWRLGFNIGATWQHADVRSNRFDLGYGLASL